MEVAVPPPHVAEPAMPEINLHEGALGTMELTTYERSASARHLCITHHGAICQACGLAYEEKYGAIGTDLIHVHHVTPISSIGADYEVDPIKDLIPLCATCHHVVHSRQPPYTAAEVRAAIVSRAGAKVGENSPRQSDLF